MRMSMFQKFSSKAFSFYYMTLTIDMDGCGLSNKAYHKFLLKAIHFIVKATLPVVPTFLTR